MMRALHYTHFNLQKSSHADALVMRRVNGVALAPWTQHWRMVSEVAGCAGAGLCGKSSSRGAEAPIS